MLSNTNASWPLKPLSEVVDFNPRLDKSGYRDDLDVSFVPMAAVEAGSGRIEVSQTKRFAAVKKGYTPFREGDVLFAKITPCMENGKMAVVPKLTNGVGFGSTEFHVMRPRPGIEPRYVYHFVSNMSFRREAAHHMTGAVGQKRVPTSFLEDAPIPVPPFDQQQLLVAEIEKQFSRLDEAVANLRRVKANLKRYKASVLKAAVEGKLTEDWRKQHPNVEPASKLLERILQERRVEWTGRGKYQEPAEPDTSTLPSLPDGWSWAAVDQLCDFITKGTTPIAEKLREVAGDVPFLKVYNLTFTGRLDFTIKPTFVDRAVHEGELVRSKVKMGDVLINIVGPPLGQVSIVPDSLVEANINQAIARFRVLGSMSNHYVAAGLMSESIMGWAIKRAKTTVGQSNLTLELCRALPFPVPPLDEQKAIVLEVERRLSVIEELEATVEANLTRAERMRQSILSQAFSGRLVKEKSNNHFSAIAR